MPGARAGVDPGGRGVDRGAVARAGGGGPERGERGVQRGEHHPGRSAAALDRHPPVAGAVHGHDGQRRRRRAADGQGARHRPDPGEGAGPGAGPRVAHHRAVGEPDGVHVADAVVPAQRRHQRVEECDVVDSTVAGRPAARPRVPGAVEPVRVGDHQALAVGERVPAQVRAHVGGRAPGAVQHHHERGAGGRRRATVHGRGPVAVGGAQGDRAQTRRRRHDGGRAAREPEERHDLQEHRRRRRGVAGRPVAGGRTSPWWPLPGTVLPRVEPGWVIEEVTSQGELSVRRHRCSHGRHADRPLLAVPGGPPRRPLPGGAAAGPAPGPRRRGARRHRGVRPAGGPRRAARRAARRRVPRPRRRAGRRRPSGRRHLLPQGVRAAHAAVPRPLPLLHVRHRAAPPARGVPRARRGAGDRPRGRRGRVQGGAVHPRRPAGGALAGGPRVAGGPRLPLHAGVRARLRDRGAGGDRACCRTSTRAS